MGAPERPTEHFLPIVVAENYLHVGTMSQSQTQQGTQSSTQILETADVAGLSALLADVRSAKARQELAWPLLARRLLK